MSVMSDTARVLRIHILERAYRGLGVKAFFMFKGCGWGVYCRVSAYRGLGVKVFLMFQGCGGSA